VDLRTVAPIDRETIVNSVRKTRRLLIVSETWNAGGSAAEVAAIVGEDLCRNYTIRIARLGLPGIPRPFALSLEKMVIPDEAKIADTIRSMLAN
jgi:pyruvate/2-oxoglutarate/acetoin dehydrogenase E1 component